MKDGRRPNLKVLFAVFRVTTKSGRRYFNGSLTREAD